MMDFINDISTSSVLDDIRKKYREMTGKEIQIGSDEFAISSVVAYIFGVLVQKFNNQAKQRYLSTATGEYLDAIGETFDIPRPSPIHASTTIHVEISKEVTLTPGSFIVSDVNGVCFTPLEAAHLVDDGNIVFVGFGNENVLNENNIEIGAIKQIKTPLDGVSAVSNQTVSGGARDAFPRTDEGDELYRQYIKAQRLAMASCGTATAYEQRAKQVDSRILDAYCPRYQDAEWVPGAADVYILITKEGNVEEIVKRVSAALNDESWRPCCDSISARDADRIALSLEITVGLSTENAVSGRTKFEKDMTSYVNSVCSSLGKAFSLAELGKFTQTPDSDGVKTEYLAIENDSNYFPIRKSAAWDISWEAKYVVV